MAEPQPSAVQEGDTSTSVPAAAEDRKAADALSKLDARGSEDDNSNAKGTDTKALGDAMKGLTVGSKDGSTSSGSGGGAAETAGSKKETAVKKSVVKVDQADVQLLVEQCDLSKVKATELLKAHDADAVKAMTAFVTASA